MGSVGIDLIEISRIKKSMQRESFLKRILGESEYIELEKRKFPIQSVAASFCAKEAFLKSLGKGLSFCNLNNIEILRKQSGEPYLKLSGKALKYSQENNLDFSISLTHTKEYACAVVISKLKEN